MWSLVLLFTVSAYAASCPSYSVNLVAAALNTFDTCYSGVASASSSNEADFCGCLAPLVDSLGGLSCVNTAGGVTPAFVSWITSQGSGLASQIDAKVSGNHGADFVTLFTTFSSYSVLGTSYTQLSSSAAGGWSNNWITTCGPELGFIFEDWLDDSNNFANITTIWDTTNAMWDTHLISANGLQTINGDVLQETVTWGTGVTSAQEDTFIGSLTYWCWIESNYGDFTRLIPGSFIKNGGMGCYAYRDSETSNVIKFRLGVNQDFTPIPSTVSFVATYPLPNTTVCAGPAGANIDWITAVNNYFSTLVISGLEVSNCSSGTQNLVVSGTCPGHHDITNEVYDILAAYPDSLPRLDLVVTVNDQAWLTKMQTSSLGSGPEPSPPSPPGPDDGGNSVALSVSFVVMLVSALFWSH